MKWRWVAATCALVLAALATQWAINRRFREGWDRDLLPAFDAYAYVAMAEHPRYFTVGPWGYRILTSWMVGALPLDPVRGFEVVTFAGLAASGVLLAVFLRRLGHGEVASALSAVVFVFLGPTREIVQYPFLVDPVTLALEVAFLAVVAGAGTTGVLALVAILGAMAKELQIMLVPLVFFARLPADGARTALRKTAVVGAAVVAAMLLIRTWVPMSDTAALGRPSIEAFLVAWRRDWPETWRGLLMQGFLPVAVAGACLRRSRPYLMRFGYGLVVTLLVPFGAFLYVGDSRVIFFGKNTERVLVYAIPFLLPLALHVIDAIRGRAAAAPDERAADRRVSRAVGALAVIVLVALGLGLDRYRRLDLRGARDGPLLLTFCRESLASARRLQRGRVIVFDPERNYFVAGRSDARDLGRMRWYLRDGWGPRPSSISAGEVVTQEPRATVVLPCLTPADWQLTLWLSSPEPQAVRVDVNGRPLGEVRPEGEGGRRPIVVPRDALFRGDNLIGLTAAAPGVRLHRVMVRPVGASETIDPAP